MITIDIYLRIEKAFKIEMPDDWVDRLGLRWEDPISDATLAQYHEFVLRLCREQGVLPPADSWEQIVKAVEDASGISAKNLTVDTRIIRDVASSG